MSDLGKYWAGEPAVTANPLNNTLESAAFHRVDIAGVASSILATPTIKSPPSQRVGGLFCFYCHRVITSVTDLYAGFDTEYRDAATAALSGIIDAIVERVPSAFAVVSSESHDGA